jgi:HEAT repeat protein
MIEETLEEVQDFEWGHSVGPFLELDREIRKVCEHPDEREKLEAALVKILRSDASRAAKRMVCQRLSLIGGEPCIPVLAEWLVKPDVSDFARFALEPIPSPQVDEALRNALLKTSGPTQMGVINSVGVRKDTGAASILGELLQSPDAETAAAAARALGQIGNDDSMELLAAAKASDRAKVRAAILDARLACAERMVEEGRSEEAKAVYRELSGDEVPRVVRQAARRGFDRK